MEFAEIIESYMMSEAGGSIHTTRAKRYDLDHFLNFLRDFCQHEPLLADWTKRASSEFVEDRLILGEKPATVARRIFTLKHLANFVIDHRLDLNFVNPVKSLKVPKSDNNTFKSLETEDLELLLAAAEAQITSDEYRVMRDGVIILLFLATGMRADELRNLRLEQFAEDLSEIREVRTKGRKFRNIYIIERLRSHLRTYVTCRNSELVKKHRLNNYQLKKAPFFVSFHGARPENLNTFLLSPKSLWLIVNKFKKHLSSHLHPHLLRHTFALDLLGKSDFNIRLVAQALGHADLKTTMKYTEQSKRSMIEAMER